MKEINKASCFKRVETLRLNKEYILKTVNQWQLVEDTMSQVKQHMCGRWSLHSGVVSARRSVSDEFTFSVLLNDQQLKLVTCVVCITSAVFASWEIT